MRKGRGGRDNVKFPSELGPDLASLPSAAELFADMLTECKVCVEMAEISAHSTTGEEGYTEERLIAKKL